MCCMYMWQENDPQPLCRLKQRRSRRQLHSLSEEEYRPLSLVATPSISISCPGLFLGIHIIYTFPAGCVNTLHPSHRILPTLPPAWSSNTACVVYSQEKIRYSIFHDVALDLRGLFVKASNSPNLI